MSENLVICAIETSGDTPTEPKDAFVYIFNGETAYTSLEELFYTLTFCLTGKYYPVKIGEGDE